VTIRDTYLAAWNETDKDARDALLASGWDVGATYVDPLAEVSGVDAISDLIAAVQGHYPGHVFTPVGEVDAHHAVTRFQWGLGLPGEEPAAVGFDVVSLDDDGRIRAVTGFLDRVPG
jgi:hypothetical protein